MSRARRLTAVACVLMLVACKLPMLAAPGVDDSKATVSRAPEIPGGIHADNLARHLPVLASGDFEAAHRSPGASARPSSTSANSSPPRA